MRKTHTFVILTAAAALAACGSPLKLSETGAGGDTSTAASTSASTAASTAATPTASLAAGQASDANFPLAIDVRTSSSPSMADIFLGTGKSMCDDLNDVVMRPNETQLHMLVGVVDASNSGKAPLTPGVYIPRDLGFKAPSAGNWAAVSFVRRDAQCNGVGPAGPGIGAGSTITIIKIDATGITGSYDLVGANNQHTVGSFSTVTCAGVGAPYEWGGIGDNVGAACESFEALNTAATGDSNYTKAIDVRSDGLDVFISNSDSMCNVLNDGLQLPNTPQLHFKLGEMGANGIAIPGAVNGTYTTLAQGTTPPGLSDYAYVTLDVADATCNAATGSGYAEAGGKVVVDKIDDNAVMGSYDFTIAGTGRHMTGTFHTTTCASKVVPHPYGGISDGSTTCP